MCTVLMEESCAFDLGLTEEQTAEMIRMASQQHGNQAPEKGSILHRSHFISM